MYTQSTIKWGKRYKTQQPKATNIINLMLRLDSIQERKWEKKGNDKQKIEA